MVGGGPAGSAAAYWLAEAGYDVVALERKHFPREKTCGDGLTPRSVRQLVDIGLGDALADHHRFEGLRAMAFGRELLLPWPEHPDFPAHGYVVTRADLDALVAERAEKAGATLWQGAEALAPLSGAAAAAGGAALGAVVADRDHGGTVELRARYVVVADGSNSRFGRALGAGRDREVPLGMAIRGYYASPRHDEPWIESHLDIRKDGAVVPGYGWIFPLGDGRVNVGIGLLSTSDRWKQVNTTRLLEAFVDFAPASWCLAPETSLGPATGGKLPMGLSVGPRVGPDYLLAGDAGGSINPFNGEGIAYGYETGRLAAAIDRGGPRRGRSPPPRRLRRAPGRHLRPLLQGRQRLRAPDGQARAAAAPRRDRDALPDPHGVALADHGEPAPPRRGGPGRGRLPGGGGASPRWPEPGSGGGDRPGGPLGGPEGGGELLLPVGERGEGHLVGARGERHPSEEHLPEEGGVAAVRRSPAGPLVVADRLVGEEACRGGSPRRGPGPPARPRRAPRRGPNRAGRPARPGRCSRRARQPRARRGRRRWRAGSPRASPPGTRARGGPAPPSASRRPPNAASGSPPPITFPKHHRSGWTPKDRATLPRCEAEAGDDLVEA